MKGSDFVARFVKQTGVRHAFVLTGGACAHLIDSFSAEPDLQVVCMQHEQAAAMAADGYARVHESRLGVAVATSGPGATNLITGIACAYFDSVPALFITGQVNTFESKGELGIRQLGFQETDIVSMVKPITKSALLVRKPEDLRRCLEEAVYRAQEGRPGPVLVDIPFNVQTADVDPERLERFEPPVAIAGGEPSLPALSRCIERLRQSERPVLLLGYGVRAAGARQEALALAEALQIPVVTSWSGLDLIANEHPLYRGQIGVYGARAANFTVQNADFLLSIGSRLDSRQTGGKFDSFARAAFRVIVDVDAEELRKPRVTPDLPIAADAKVFISALLAQLRTLAAPQAARAATDWLGLTARWRAELPVDENASPRPGAVNPYRFFERLSARLAPDAIILGDTGANLTWMMQGLALRARQRLISAFGNSPMGYALPAAIGAAFAQPGCPILCVTGDGGFQLNLQELQTLQYHGLPLKIVVMNNRGYGIIKQFQQLYLEGRYAATGEGYSCPDFGDVIRAYRLPFARAEGDGDIDAGLDALLSSPGPSALEVVIDPEEKITPKLGWGRPIEDQLPLLPRPEFRRYMLIEPLELSNAPVREVH